MRNTIRHNTIEFCTNSGSRGNSGSRKKRHSHPSSEGGDRGGASLEETERIVKGLPIDVIEEWKQLGDMSSTDAKAEYLHMVKEKWGA